MAVEGWRVVETADGSFTLAHAGHGEACHSRDGAWSESLERYVCACRVPERLAEQSDAPLRVLDVGTGPGWNLAALLPFLDGARRPLAVTSVERDPAVLPAAMRALAVRAGGEGGGPEPLRRLARLYECIGGEAGAARLAAEGERTVALARNARLALHLGEAGALLAALPECARFDAIFLDPFSPRVEAGSWRPALLRALALRLEPDGWLSTYSAATAVRAGLAAAGLRVGRGARFGGKREGTLATPKGVPPALDARTARRIARRAADLRRAGGAARPVPGTAPGGSRGAAGTGNSDSGASARAGA